MAGAERAETSLLSARTWVILIDVGNNFFHHINLLKETNIRSLLGPAAPPPVEDVWVPENCLVRILSIPAAALHQHMCSIVVNLAKTA